MPKMTQEVANKAGSIGARYQADMKSISDNASLSTDGKRVAMAQAHVQMSKEMAALRESFEGTATKTVETNTRSLFGQAQTVSGQDAVSVRDASDRADKIETPAEAMRAYERASNNSDDHLVRAIVQKAYDSSQGIFGSGWSDVLQHHSDRTPEFADRFNEMADARASGVDEVMNAMHFVLVKPTLLDRMADTHIEALANGQAAGV